MEVRLKVTEYLDLDIEEEMWHCSKCNHKIISATENYKKGCLVYDRDPRSFHPTIVNEEINFSPDPNWIRIIEFYCQNCGTQIETEYLPPGHPITHDIEIDLDRLKDRLKSGEYSIEHKRLKVQK